jgi:hypothetical protein
MLVLFPCNLKRQDSCQTQSVTVRPEDGEIHEKLSQCLAAGQGHQGFTRDYGSDSFGKVDARRHSQIFKKKKSYPKL